MRITDVKTIRLVHRYPGGQTWRWSGGHFDSWASVLVQVVTDDGVTGLGEVYQGNFVGGAVQPFVDHFKSWLIGEDPLAAERLWEKLYNLSAFWNRQGFPIGILGAIDIALYDIAGKVAGVPVYRMLAAAPQSRQRVYYSAGCADSAEQLFGEIRDAVASGFKAYKWRVLDPARAPTIMAVLREEAGPDFQIMVDAVQGSAPAPWPKQMVLDLARALEPCRPAWLEEPFRIEDPDRYAELRRLVSYPIAGAESVTTLAELERFLAVEALDIFQPDVTFAGGFTLSKRMARLAESRGVKLAMHCWGGGVALMANLHFGFSQPGCIFVEYPRYPNPLREEVLCEPLKVELGSVAPPAQPGLGVRLTEELVRKYQAAGTEHAGLVFEMG